MALEGSGGDSDRVNIGTNAFITNLGVETGATCVGWYWLDSISPGAQRNFWGKSTGATRKTAQISAGNLLQLTVVRPTTSMNVGVATTSVPGLAAGEWCCIAMAWNTRLTDTDQHFYCGNLKAPMREPASYSSQLVGTGTVGDDSGTDLQLLNTGDTAGPVNSIDGRCAWMGFWRTQLNRGQLEQLRRAFLPWSNASLHPQAWWRPALWMPLGVHGASGRQVDLVGHAVQGVVTGCTWVSNAPLRNVLAGVLDEPILGKRSAAAAMLPPSLLVQQAVKRAAYW